MEQARQYEGPAEQVPPVAPMSVADLRVMDDSLPQQPPKRLFPGADPLVSLLVLGAFLFTGLLILAYSFVPLFLAWTRSEEPVLKQEAGEGPMAETAIAVPAEPAEEAAAAGLKPQPTESEAIVRAMQGPDPYEGVLLKPMEAKDLEAEKLPSAGEPKEAGHGEEHKEEEKMAA
jgi:hypothetical protein